MPDALPWRSGSQPKPRQAFRKKKRDLAQARAAAKAQAAREKREQQKRIAEAQAKALHDMLMKQEEAEDARLRRKVAGPVDVMVTSLHLIGMDRGLEEVTEPQLVLSSHMWFDMQCGLGLGIELPCVARHAQQRS